MLQLELPISSCQKPSNLTEVVRDVMLENGWCTPYVIQREVERRTGGWHSDSSLTARIRELRRVEFGGYAIEKRHAGSGASFEYRIAGREQ